MAEAGAPAAPAPVGLARRFWVGGNFKMNGTRESLRELIREFNHASLDPQAEVVIAPPAIYVDFVRSELRKDIAVGIQNCHQADSGAFTGEISSVMALDSGVQWIILGHSERRQIFGESDELVGAKVAKVLEKGLRVVACVGETQEQRAAGKTNEVVDRQLEAIAAHVSNWSRVVVAYEPVWAIGTGLTATPAQAQEVHAHIRSWLRTKAGDAVADSTRIVYGGSVRDNNSATLAKQGDVDGFLVGGASLKPEFIAIINARLQA